MTYSSSNSGIAASAAGSLPTLWGKHKNARLNLSQAHTPSQKID
jgi:hypothetical protein